MTESPDDWTPARRLIERELARLNRITADTVARIRDELPDFVLVPADEHARTVHGLLRLRLMAFAERRAWTGDDLKEAVRLARRRARQGVSVDSLISAFHVGDRELWRSLSEEPGEAAPLLPELTSLMLESMQAVSTTLAATHSHESRDRDRLHLSATQRLVELLASGGEDAEVARLAHFLGLRESSAVRAIVTAGDEDEPTDDLDVHPAPGDTVLQGRLRGLRVALVVTERPGDPVDIHRLPGNTGVGSPATGWVGASRSLRQALIAAEVATQEEPVAVFAQVWPLGALPSLAHLLDEEVHRVIEVAAKQPTLRATVQAFAAADMSKQGCAVACHVHPNTVTYRLDRWASLTGWDPRTFDGLTRSLLASRLAELRAPLRA